MPAMVSTFLDLNSGKSWTNLVQLNYMVLQFICVFPLINRRGNIKFVWNLGKLLILFSILGLWASKLSILMDENVHDMIYTYQHHIKKWLNYFISGQKCWGCMIYHLIKKWLNYFISLPHFYIFLNKKVQLPITWNFCMTYNQSLRITII